MTMRIAIAVRLVAQIGDPSERLVPHEVGDVLDSSVFLLTW